MPKRKLSEMSDAVMRSSSKRSKTVRRTRRVPKSLGPARTMQSFTTNLRITLSGTGYESVSYILNSVTDPYQSGATNQPRGLAEYKDFYSRSIVRSFSMSVKGVCTAGTSAVVCMGFAAGSLPSDSSAFRLTELEHFKSRIVLEGGNNVIQMSTGINTVKKVYGNRELDYTDFGQLLSGTANPSRQIPALISMQSMDATSSSTVQLIVSITQMVEMFDIKAVSAV